MLTSASNLKKGPKTPISEKRESAPPAFRTPASSTLSTPNGSFNMGQPPKQRPRSGSHVQISLYSQMTTPRPLPAIPTTAKRAASLTPDDSIKVPVDDDGSLPSPHTLNSNRLHPNGYAPQSPQFLLQGMMGPSTSARATARLSLDRHRNKCIIGKEEDMEEVLERPGRHIRRFFHSILNTP
ncbi:hypothetical protein BGX29_007439 [Mortierella sp. GBA35]|nr:hypothetical protein BGX29_007439 [Mortierella sp. GBA35]